MSRLTNSLFFGIFFISSALSLSFTEYTCPEVKHIENFNVSAYISSGEKLWYEIARYPNELDQDNKCRIYKVTSISGGLKADLVSVAMDKGDAVPVTIIFRPHNNGTLTLDITLGSNRFNFEEHIVAIEYGLYYIVYQCLYDERTKLWNEYSWILTTSKNPDAAVKTAINEVIKSSKFLDASKFEWFDLEDKNCQVID